MRKRGKSGGGFAPLLRETCVSKQTHKAHTFHKQQAGTACADEARRLTIKWAHPLNVITHCESWRLELGLFMLLFILPFFYGLSTFIKLYINLWHNDKLTVTVFRIQHDLSSTYIDLLWLTISTRYCMHFHPFELYMIFHFPISSIFFCKSCFTQRSACTSVSLFFILVKSVQLKSS